MDGRVLLAKEGVLSVLSLSLCFGVVLLLLVCCGVCVALFSIFHFVLLVLLLAAVVLWPCCSVWCRAFVLWSRVFRHVPWGRVSGGVWAVHE